ncbi:MAG: tripartite tricarboxylate transporter TctB family protein [Saprospiraceae bacterium]|nr:tripartite tricarboxylate transporter TctB family protein [Saprospiraceae bacterium]
MKVDRISEIIFSVIVTALGLLVFVTARGFPELPEGHPGPGLFPAYLGGGLLLCGILLLINALKFQAFQTSGFEGKWILVVSILAIMVIFPFFYRLVGFFVAIAFAILLVGLLMRLKFISAILTSLITTGFIYLVFNQILHVPL